MDFLLSRGGQNFLAQQTAWTDGTWVYMIRVVTPDNARDFLYWLTDEMVSHFHILDQFKNTPMGWTAFHDRRTNTILRYPNSWRILDGGSAGRPITVGIDDGTAIVANTIDGQVGDETAARDFVSGLRRNVTVVSVMPISRVGASGFSVAYRFATPDGEERSALAILLNGSAGKLHTAIGQISRGGVDLNSQEGRAQFFDLTTALDSFSLLSGLNLPALPEPTPIPTRPAPTSTPEIELTPEMTPEGTPEA